MAKLWLLFFIVALTAVLCSAQNQELEQQLDPVRQSELSNDALEGDGERGDREKRLFLIKKIGLKAGLLDFVFGKIDSFIDSKTRYINELDKQNIYKNEKYFGITYPPKTDPHNNLVGNLIGIKKNLLGSAVSGFIQAKLNGGGALHGGAGASYGGAGAGASASFGGASASFGGGSLF